MPVVCSVFWQTASGEKLAILLQQLSETEQTALEQIPASPQSPGVVAAGEALFRALDQPLHFDENGEIKPTAFGDSESHGLSVNRLAHSTIEAATRRARDRVAAVNQRKLEHSAANVQHSGGLQPPRTTVAYVTFNSSKLRALSSSAHGLMRRAFGVYDTAKSDDHSHGDVCVLVTGKQAQRSVREMLYQQAKHSVVRLTNVTR